MVSGFVSEKPNAVHNAKDHLPAAVVGVQILRGLSHFEMTLTSDLEAVGINGRLRHTITLGEIKSIASALLKRKEAHSAKGPDARVPIGVVPHLGRVLFEMTRTAEVVAVNMLGRLNLELQLLQRNQFVESALKKQKEALSVRVPAKAAVDGAQTRFPHGHCRFEMTPIIVEEAALILGIWTAPQNVMLRFVRETLHAPEKNLHNFRTASM